MRQIYGDKEHTAMLDGHAWPYKYLALGTPCDYRAAAIEVVVTWQEPNDQHPPTIDIDPPIDPDGLEPEPVINPGECIDIAGGCIDTDGNYIIDIDGNSECTILEDETDNKSDVKKSGVEHNNPVSITDINLIIDAGNNDMDFIGNFNPEDIITEGGIRVIDNSEDNTDINSEDNTDIDGGNNADETPEWEPYITKEIRVRFKADDIDPKAGLFPVLNHCLLNNIKSSGMVSQDQGNGIHFAITLVATPTSDNAIFRDLFRHTNGGVSIMLTADGDHVESESSHESPYRSVTSHITDYYANHTFDFNIFEFYDVRDTEGDWDAVAIKLSTDFESPASYTEIARLLCKELYFHSQLHKKPDGAFSTELDIPDEEEGSDISTEEPDEEQPPVEYPMEYPQVEPEEEPYIDIGGGEFIGGKDAD